MGATAGARVSATGSGVGHFTRAFTCAARHQCDSQEQTPPQQTRECNQEKPGGCLWAAADLATGAGVGCRRCAAVGIVGFRQRCGRPQVGEDRRWASVGVYSGVRHGCRRVSGIPEALGATLMNLAALSGWAHDVGAPVGTTRAVVASEARRAGHTDARIPFAAAVAAAVTRGALNPAAWISHTRPVQAALSQGTGHLGARADAPSIAAELTRRAVDLGAGIALAKSLPAALTFWAAAVRAVVGSTVSFHADLAAGALHVGAGIHAATGG